MPLKLIDPLTEQPYIAAVLQVLNKRDHHAVTGAVGGGKSRPFSDDDLHVMMFLASEIGTHIQRLKVDLLMEQANLSLDSDTQAFINSFYTTENTQLQKDAHSSTK